MNTKEIWTVEYEHRVPGSPATVFEYFTDPQKYQRWKGQDAELDPRPGGIYRVSFLPGVWVSGEYLVVDPPDRILLSWGFESTIELPSGLAQVPAGSTTVEFSFVVDGDGTIVRVRHMGLPSEEAHWAHGLGWKRYLPRLATVLGGGDPGPDPVIENAAVLYAGPPGASASRAES
jgi:uncharacterized protein YndB with AHSA1/START domain